MKRIHFRAVKSSFNALAMRMRGRLFTFGCSNALIEATFVAQGVIVQEVTEMKAA